MKKIFRKSNIFAFILGAIIFGSIGVIATNYVANDVNFTPKDTAWKKEDGTDITNVKDALDNLYNRNNSFCKKITGSKTTIGSKYECDPGDGKYRVFYVLKVNDNTVGLIMDRNINSGTMNHATALAYFTSGDGKNLGWSNVQSVDNPKAEDIANAVGNTGWNVSTATTDNKFYFDKYNGNYQNSTQVANASNRSSYGWLYEHTRECEAYGCPLNTSLDSTGTYGYWTQEKVSNDSNRAWNVGRSGHLDNINVDSANLCGVRPVITVLKSQLN